MDDREQQRKVKHRLAMIRHAQEVTGNVAQLNRNRATVTLLPSGSGKVRSSMAMPRGPVLRVVQPGALTRQCEGRARYRRMAKAWSAADAKSGPHPANSARRTRVPAPRVVDYLMLRGASIPAVTGVPRTHAAPAR
jgi:hypothetical protein